MLKAIDHYRQEAPVDHKERMRHHLTILREYAKLSILRGYSFAPRREAHRNELIREFMELGETFKLTHCEMVTLLYKGLFQPSWDPEGN